MPPASSFRTKLLKVMLAAIPIVALTIATPLANRDEPRILGLPFLMAWIMIWVLLVPVVLWTIGRIERHW